MLCMSGPMLLDARLETTMTTQKRHNSKHVHALLSTAQNRKTQSEHVKLR